MARISVTERDLQKAAKFFRACGVVPVHAEIFPGKISLELSDGRALTLPDDAAEIERNKDNWDANVRRRTNTRAQAKAS